jgi:hypothetical protein
MKLAKVPTGLLFNFNVTVLRNGIRRLVLTPTPEDDNWPDSHTGTAFPQAD